MSMAHAGGPLAGRRGGSILWAASGVLSLAVALASYRYLIGVGPFAPNVAANGFRDPWLVVHVAGAASALLVAPLQFLPRLRARFGALHRWMGRVYVLGCLVGGVSGFVLALGASTGPVSTAGFGTLAVLWFVSTAQAWRLAVRRDFAGHRAWMMRSFALTFAAVTLRLYLPISMLAPFGFEDSYRAISFLCWVPNLVVAELYIRKSRRGLASPAAA